MAGSVTFILKNPNAKEETLIYLMYWYDQLRIKISTGERIRRTQWNKNARRAKRTPENKNLNRRLDNLEKLVMDASRDYFNKNKEIFIKELTSDLVEVIRPKPQQEEEPMTFLKAIQECIDTTNNSYRTKLSYGTTLNVLKEYSAYLKTPISFDDIDMTFYNSFFRYLTKERGFTKNTIGDHIKKIKVFMNYALDKKYTTNKEHLHNKFIAVSETPETIYLNDAELTILYNTDFSDNPRLDRVRDLFIIGCYTGLRFSDLSQLSPNKFTDNGTRLRITTVKTGEKVVIPLHYTIKEILAKYEGKTPRALSNQKMNEYIKEVVKNAGINETVTVVRTKGGKKEETITYKYNLCTVHTARRAFCTNMYLVGLPTLDIMKISGHRTERAFLKYIKVSPDEVADKVSKHPYFNQSPLKVVNQ